jgi:flagellar biosynthesis/type III secretory pathway protein FliH
MIEIIRAPKVNKRPRVLPCSQAKTNGANRARAATSKSPNAAKLNGSAVEQATDVNGGKAGPDKALHDALDQANHRADAAEQSLRQLQQEIEQQFADAKERGFDEGFRAGGEQSTKENEKCIAARLGSLDDLCADMRAEFDASLNDAVQDTVVEVVIAAAGKFLGDALTDRDSVVAVVEQMTRNVESSHTIRVRVSPADFDFLDTHDGRVSEGTRPIPGCFGEYRVTRKDWPHPALFRTRRRGRRAGLFPGRMLRNVLAAGLRSRTRGGRWH